MRYVTPCINNTLVNRIIFQDPFLNFRQRKMVKKPSGQASKYIPNLTAKGADFHCPLRFHSDYNLIQVNLNSLVIAAVAVFITVKLRDEGIEVL